MFKIIAYHKQSATCAETASFFQELRDEGLCSVNPDGSINIVISHEVDGTNKYTTTSSLRAWDKARRMYDDFIYIDMFAVVLDIYEGDKKIIKLDTDTRTITVYATETVDYI